ncbi:MAG: DUF2281 domain-containing protein [Leptolyngbya sp. SIOISBB]|nr:DUF2281 domain-containing protein [Leptolyngbya sp. SIOISBB]
MTVDAEILQTVLQLPTPLKQELLHYAKYLVNNYAPSDSTETPQQKYRQAGTMKDMFVLPLPDDFDEPLEDMREYME